MIDWRVDISSADYYLLEHLDIMLYVYRIRSCLHLAGKEEMIDSELWFRENYNEAVYNR